MLFSSILILVVFSGVISRYFLNASLAWSEELSRFLFVWIMLLAAVLVNEKSGHMRFDYLVQHVPRKVASFIRIVALLIVALISLVLIRGGVTITLESTDWLSPALQVPYAAVNCILVISFTLILFQTIRRLISQIISFYSDVRKNSQA